MAGHPQYPFRAGGDANATMPVAGEDDWELPEDLRMDDTDFPSFGPTPVHFGSDDEILVPSHFNLLANISNDFGMQADQAIEQRKPRLQFPTSYDARFQARAVRPSPQAFSQSQAYQPIHLSQQQHFPSYLQPNDLHGASPTEARPAYYYPQTHSLRNLYPYQQSEWAHNPVPMTYAGQAVKQQNYSQLPSTVTAPAPSLYTYQHTLRASDTRPNQSSARPAVGTPSPRRPSHSHSLLDEHSPVKSNSSQSEYLSLPRSFASAEEARAFRKHVRKQPPPDDTIAGIEANKLLWVDKVYRAMISLDQASDRPREGGANTKGHANHDFGAWSACKFDQREVEAGAWNVVEHCLKLHTLGQRFDDRYNKAKGEDRTLTCEQRLNAVCDLLRTWKSACCEVVRGRNVDHVVNQPHASLRIKRANKDGNAVKAEALEEGRKIIDQRPKLAPARRRPSTIHSRPDEPVSDGSPPLPVVHPTIPGVPAIPSTETQPAHRYSTRKRTTATRGHDRSDDNTDSDFEPHKRRR